MLGLNPSSLSRNQNSFFYKGKIGARSDKNCQSSSGSAYNLTDGESMDLQLFLGCSLGGATSSVLRVSLGHKTSMFPKLALVV